MSEIEQPELNVILKTRNMKARIWKCLCCGDYKRRFRNENQQPCCNRCNEDMVQGFKTSTQKRCKHIRKRIKEVKEQNSYYSNYCTKLRNAGGRVLRFSKETRRLWKSVNKVKQVPTLLKRAELWLDSLRLDICEGLKDENAWAKSLHQDGTISRERQIGGVGISCIPKLKIIEFDGCLHGCYRKHFLQGIYEIQWARNNIIEMKRTLLHETLHYIDDMSKTPSNHDKNFDTRLKRLRDVFKVKEETQMKGGRNEHD